jgi:integrase/recombinase XerD
LQHRLRLLKGRVGVTGRLSPHSLRHTFARSYLVNGGDVLSLQRILGHTGLDMVTRYVALADVDLVTRHAAASPADRLAGKDAGSESTIRHSRQRSPTRLDGEGRG